MRAAQAAGEERRKDAELLLKRHDTIEGIKLKTAEQARKDRETDNRIDIGLAELDLAIDAAAEAGPEATKLTAIASQNSSGSNMEEDLILTDEEERAVEDGYEGQALLDHPVCLLVIE